MLLKKNTNKKTIRDYMRKKRKALPKKVREIVSDEICQKLTDEFLLSETIPLKDTPLVVYFASPNEINLTNFISSALELGRTILSPRWNGETYELAKIKSLESCDIRTGPMNILEPADADIVNAAEAGVWIIPGLAFTASGKRLGYGGGWYDRLLAQASRKSLKIGVAHSFQIIKDLPSEAHDVTVDRIITPKE